MRAARTDANQKEIVVALRKAGATVHHLHTVGGGCPDLVVGYQGVNYLMEIKTKTGKLTPREQEFFDLWAGRCVVVRSAERALNVIGLL